MIKRNKVAIIGAGKGGTAFLHMLSDYQKLELVGIMDFNQNAPGLKLAYQLGISVFENYLDFFNIPGLKLIINLTGDSSVDLSLNEFMVKRKINGEEKNNLEILGGMSAMLFWEIIRNAKLKEDEKAKLAKNMLKLNYDLNDVKEYLENILENSDDMIITTDLNQSIVSFNRGAENQLGYTRKEVINKNINLIWKNKKERLKLLHDLQNNGSVLNYETELVKKDKKTLLVNLTLSYLKNQAGKIIGTVGISKDFTEKKKMEKELLRSHKELEDFVFTISHDLQAPLRAIYGFSELLLEEKKENLEDSSSHYLERIKIGADRMKLLIDDLLDLSRIGRKGPNFENIDIKEMLQTIKEFFYFDIKSKNGKIKIVANFPSTIYCNKVRIQQVFSNLISNSIKFTPDKQLIEIGYTERKNCHEFFVKDNGIGISPRYHKKIFKIFQRLHNAEEYEGTGIGLTIVTKIVEIHNGKVWLNSVKNQGATFYFTIDKNIKNTVP